jgi:hypothetical protein
VLTSFKCHSLPAYNKQLKFFTERPSFLETQNNFSYWHAACHVHFPGKPSGQEKKENEKGKGRIDGGEVEAQKNKPQKEATPSFSSPWAPSSCSPKRVLWKEVEDYNRQRKRVRFLGWAGVENPWETEASSTVCSECSDCSDSDGSFGQTKPSDVPAEDPTMVAEEGTEGAERKWEVRNCEGIKVVITTLKDGTTITTLETGPHTELENGVEIVTKTVVCGTEVTTITTTTLLPLAAMNSKKCYRRLRSDICLGVGNANGVAPSGRGSGEAWHETGACGPLAWRISVLVWPKNLGIECQAFSLGVGNPSQSVRFSLRLLGDTTILGLCDSRGGQLVVVGGDEEGVEPWGCR